MVAIQPVLHPQVLSIGIVREGHNAVVANATGDIRLRTQWQKRRTCEYAYRHPSPGNATAMREGWAKRPAIHGSTTVATLVADPLFR